MVASEVWDCLHGRSLTGGALLIIFFRLELGWGWIWISFVGIVLHDYYGANSGGEKWFWFQDMYILYSIHTVTYTPVVSPFWRFKDALNSEYRSMLATTFPAIKDPFSSCESLIYMWHLGMRTIVLSKQFPPNTIFLLKGYSSCQVKH